LGLFFLNPVSKVGSSVTVEAGIDFYNNIYSKKKLIKLINFLKINLKFINIIIFLLVDLVLLLFFLIL